MTPKAVTLSKYIIRASAVLMVAMGASACSTVPDWANPTSWIGGSDTTDEATNPDQSAQTADNNTQTPDLSAIPDKPQAPSTADEQKQVAQSLAADRSKAQYSGDALRGGTEPAAAPPPVDAPPATEELAANDNAPPPPEAPKPAEPPPPPAAGPGTLPADNAAAQAAQQPAPAAAPVVASAAVPPPAAPAVAPAVEPMASSAAVPAVGPTAMATMPTSDAALGFRPSSAPPLDATVAQFVPPSILARYEQTATISGQPAVPGAGGTAYASNTSSRRSKSRMGTGGPETMSGAVVANFDALQGGAVAPAAYAGTGMPGAPAAVVFFPHDTTVLDEEAKSQIRAAAKAFLAQGGQGYVKVIGHSSSRTGNMTASRHLVWNFERSQARANAVARALIHEGVPAERVLVQAVGDDQPVYQESMPQGEDGNRRAEIYFQS